MTPGAGSDGSHPGDSRLVILDAWSRRESPWILWMCDYRFRLWGYPGLCICTPSCLVWGGGVTLETVDVWPQVQCLQRGVTLDTENVTPGPGSRAFTLDIVAM